jgi:hypothetical protein
MKVSNKKRQEIKAILFTFYPQYTKLYAAVGLRLIIEEDAMTNAHLTSQTGLNTAINAWEIYLYDQGRSPNTVKAFLSDVRLLTLYLPPDRTIGAISTEDLKEGVEAMMSRRKAEFKGK